MLSENIKRLRLARGWSQEELALRCNVVRQTVSKWEKGLSVPDADMLIELSEQLQTSVHVLLGETVPEEDPACTVQVLSSKLEALQNGIARRRARNRRIIRGVCIAALCLIALNVLFDLVMLGYVSLPIGLMSGESVGVIGGSDGPTAIVVTSSGPNVWRLVLGGLVAAGSIVGIVLTSRRRGA